MEQNKDIKLIELNIGYSFINIFGDLVLFVDSLGEEINNNLSSLNKEKIISAIVLYKNENICKIYTNNSKYYIILSTQKD